MSRYYQEYDVFGERRSKFQNGGEPDSAPWCEQAARIERDIIAAVNADELYDRYRDAGMTDAEARKQIRDIIR